MKRPHVAIIVDSSHGHLYPTLGILSELISRGCQVSCAAGEYFSERIARSGGKPIVYNPLDPKSCDAKFLQAGGDQATLLRIWKEYEQEELENALRQLESLYETQRPDLIIYDLRTPVARVLASKWNIQKIEHSPQFIYKGGYSWVGRPYDESLVIVSIPSLFHPYVDELDKRFHFVGPIYKGRNFFSPWVSDSTDRSGILVSTTTAMAQPEFFKLIIEAFRSLPLRIILSIGDTVDPDLLGALPSNFEINTSSSHLEVLKSVSLFVYQGGVGSTLEALYCGVPLLVIPPSPSPIHDEVSHRVAELGLGIRLERTATADVIRDSATSILRSAETRQRVKEIQRVMHETNSAKLAGDLIMERLGDCI